MFSFSITGRRSNVTNTCKYQDCFLRLILDEAHNGQLPLRRLPRRRPIHGILLYFGLAQLTFKFALRNNT